MKFGFALLCSLMVGCISGPSSSENNNNNDDDDMSSDVSNDRDLATSDLSDVDMSSGQMIRTTDGLLALFVFDEGANLLARNVVSDDHLILPTDANPNWTSSFLELTDDDLMSAAVSGITTDFTVEVLAYDTGQGERFLDFGEIGLEWRGSGISAFVAQTQIQFEVTQTDRLRHIVLTRSARQIRLFVDGVMRDARLLPIENTTTDASTLVISSAGFATVALYDRDLSPVEIYRHFLSRRPDRQNYGDATSLPETRALVTMGANRVLTSLTIQASEVRSISSDVPDSRSDSFRADSNTSALIRFAEPPDGFELRRAMFHISMGNNALNTDFSVTALKRSWNAPSWNEYESGQRWQLPGALGESDRTQRVTNASSVVNDDVQEHLLVVTDQVRSWQTTSDYSPGLIIESDDELDLYRDDRNRSTAPILVYWGDLDRPQTEPLTPQGTSKTLLANNDQRVSWTSSSDLETTTYEIYFDGLLREQTSLQQFVTNEDLTPIDVRVVARDIFGRVSPVSEAAVTF